MKERTWLGILLSFAAPCRGKMAASVVLAILSVAGGFVPYLGVYQIIRLFLERQADWDGILFWCGVCLAGYAVKVAGYALSTMLAHVSAYTILEGLRLQAADRLMGAPLGEVESRPIGAMKSTIVDRIEDIEPPLAHMIPELSSNILLPLVVVAAMFSIDWRMGLALLATIPFALIPMAFGMRSYNKNYAAYMEANAHVNSVIVEYVEGIQVVKTFLLQGIHHGLVPLHLGFHEPVSLHPAHHPAGDAPHRDLSLSGGSAGPGPGNAVPNDGPGDRDPAHERHRFHQFHEEHAVCREGHPGTAGSAPVVPGGAGRAAQ